MFSLSHNEAGPLTCTRRRTAAMLAAAATVLAGLAGCNHDSASPPPSRGSPTGTLSSSAPGAAAPTVSVVPQPAAGVAGPLVTVEGAVRWVVLGLPNCATLSTSHQPPQVLSLVGPTADQLRRAAEGGHGQIHEQVRVTGYVPPAAATVCGGMSFRVTQVNPVTG